MIHTVYTQTVSFYFVYYPFHRFWTSWFIELIMNYPCESERIGSTFHSCFHLRTYFSIKNSSTEVIILVITFCMLNVQSSQMLQWENVGQGLIISCFAEQMWRGFVHKRETYFVFPAVSRWFWENWSCIIVPPVNGYIYYEHSHCN